MRNKRDLIFSLILALLCVGIAAPKASRYSGQRAATNTPAPQRQVEEADVPVVEFAAPESADPRDKALRRARSKTYDYPGDDAASKRFLLNEQSEPIALNLPLSDGPKESPLPARQSDAVVIGTVTKAQAYLSNDRTNVYSAFTTSVEDVLLSDQSGSISAGGVIEAQRQGGKVRFPSGKTLLRGALGKTMPRAGCRYLLFLKKNEDGQSFSIITGYELRDGKVSPLDGLSKNAPQSAQFMPYEGLDEAAFLRQVREAILEEMGQ